jgi:MoxR-like ATPase
MLHVQVGFPTRDEERRIMERMSDLALSGPSAQAQVAQRIAPQVSPQQLLEARGIVGQVYVDERIKDYILNVVLATRDASKVGLADLKDMIAHGASPRASIALNVAARAHAFLRHRGYVTPEDVKAVGPDVLRHRLIRTYEAEAEEITTDQIVRRIFDAVEVP